MRGPSAADDTHPSIRKNETWSVAACTASDAAAPAWAGLVVACLKVEPATSMTTELKEVGGEEEEEEERGREMGRGALEIHTRIVWLIIPYSNSIEALTLV